MIVNHQPHNSIYYFVIIYTTNRTNLSINKMFIHICFKIRLTSIENFTNEDTKIIKETFYASWAISKDIFFSSSSTYLYLFI